MNLPSFVELDYAGPSNPWVIEWFLRFVFVQQPFRRYAASNELQMRVFWWSSDYFAVCVSQKASCLRIPKAWPWIRRHRTANYSIRRWDDLWPVAAMMHAPSAFNSSAWTRGRSGRFGDFVRSSGASFLQLRESLSEARHQQLDGGTRIYITPQHAIDQMHTLTCVSMWTRCSIIVFSSNILSNRCFCKNAFLCHFTMSVRIDTGLWRGSNRTCHPNQAVARGIPENRLLAFCLENQHVILDIVGSVNTSTFLGLSTSKHVSGFKQNF